MWYVIFVLYIPAIYACVIFFFFFKQKTAYEMRISDWSSDVCSSDLTCSGKLIHYPEAIELGVAGDFAASDGALDRGVDDFQSGNGICLRDYDGQWPLSPFWIWHRDHRGFRNAFRRRHQLFEQIGRASCRERVCQYV